MDQFRPGYVYALGTSLGSYLLAIAAAEPVDDDLAPVILPPEQQLFGPVVTGRGYRPVVRSAADDNDPKSRKKR